ncbi:MULTISPECIES: hypothetical protein [unclassified Streptomyces]|uniref:hypothetical protein n=1 Tax=unclassified Streptomyces TaxID=2593676 RepID=UPI0036E93DF5
MSKVYERTENGVTTVVGRKEGLAEINDAMMGRVVRERSTRTMSSINRTDYSIVYRDGRAVTLKLVDEPAKVEAEEGPKAWTGEVTRIVTVKGKRYAAGPLRQDGQRPYLHYWSERNGETFGATRSTNGDAKPGTVGRAIWDAVNA